MKYLKPLFLLLGLGLFGLILKETDLHEVWKQISNVGFWGILIVFFLYTFTYFADVVVWLLTMPDLPINFRWLKRFYLIRMAGTAFNYVTPLASIGGEPIKAMLLKNHYGIAYRDSGISIVLAKTADVIGLVLFLTLGFVALTFSTKIGSTNKFIAGVGLIALVICITGFFLVQRYKITSTSANWLSKTSLGNKLHHVLDLIHDLEDKLVHFYTEHRSRFIITLGLAMLNWSLGTIEVYLVMQFLNHPITLADALIIESFAQLVRAGTFFYPCKYWCTGRRFFSGV